MREPARLAGKIPNKLLSPFLPRFPSSLALEPNAEEAIAWSAICET